MARLGTDELLRELDATDEGYIRRKLMLGGYGPVQAKHVQAWLAQREADRAEQRSARDLALSSRTAFWTMMGALGGLGAFIATVVALLVVKAS